MKILAVALLVLFLGIAIAQTSGRGTLSPAILSASPAPAHAENSGRYQIVFGPHARADQYLLDTWTGKMWHSVVYTDLVGEPEVWIPLERVESLPELGPWIDQKLACCRKPH